MKKMRKIIPALAMLLVSAIMMSTASFAWFTMSTTAEATGMQVQATTAGGLAIAFGTGTGATPTTPGPQAFASTVAFTTGNWTNGAEKLNPTAPDANFTNWYSAASGATDEYVAEDGSWNKVADASEKAYYYQTALFVKSLNAEYTKTSGNGENLFVNAITVAGMGTDLDYSIRVAFNVGSTWLIFAPVYTSGAGLTFKYVSAFDDVNKNATTATYDAGKVIVGASGYTGAQLATGSVYYDEATKVDVYVYFDGEDANCKTANALELSAITIAAKFSTEG